MMLFAEIIFWVSVAFITYAYVGYPLALGVVALLRTRRVEKADVLPPTTKKNALRKSWRIR